MTKSSWTQDFNSPIGCLYGWHTWMSNGLWVVLTSIWRLEPSYLLPFSTVRVFQSVQYTVSSNTVRANGWGKSPSYTVCLCWPSKSEYLEKEIESLTAFTVWKNSVTTSWQTILTRCNWDERQTSRACRWCSRLWSRWATLSWWWW